MSGLKRIGSALGAVALVAGSLALAAPALAADTTTASTKCRTSSFPEFDWNNITIKASGVTDGTETELTLEFSDLPGVVPLAVQDVPMVGVVNATVGGTAVTFNGQETIDVGARQPVSLPKVTAKIPGSASTADITVTAHKWTVTAMGSAFPTVCPSSGSFSAALTGVPVVTGTVKPSPSATPSATPSASPSASATKTPKPSATPSASKEPKEQEGTPAKGSVTFDCTLQTIGSPFTYAPKVTLEGARADADSDEVSLRLSLSDIAKADGKGLAPVAMDADMTITATAEVGGKKVDFTGKSRVNVGIYEPVPVPVMTTKADIVDETVPVKLTAFKFDFGEMAGTQWFSDCKGSGSLSKMTIGVGELKDGGGNGGGSNGGSGANGAGSTTLPRTGGGDAMPVIGLWALALGVAGAGLLVWLPRQRRSLN